jgi:hypothetical protein
LRQQTLGTLEPVLVSARCGSSGQAVLLLRQGNCHSAREEGRRIQAS